MTWALLIIILTCLSLAALVVAAVIQVVVSSWVGVLRVFLGATIAFLIGALLFIRWAFGG